MARVLLFVCGLLSVLACQAASPGGDNCELCKGWVKTLGHTDMTGNPTVATAFTTPENTFKYSLGADRQSFCAMQKHAHQFKCSIFWSHAMEQGVPQQSNLALALKFGIRLPAALACSWPKGTKAAQTAPDDACATNMCQAFGCRGAVAEKWAHNLENAMPAPKPVRGEQAHVTPPKPSPPVPVPPIQQAEGQHQRSPPAQREQQPPALQPQQQQQQQQQKFEAEGHHHRSWSKKREQQQAAPAKEQRRSPSPSPSARRPCPEVSDAMKETCAAAGGTFNQMFCKCDCRADTTLKAWNRPSCREKAFHAASGCVCATPTPKAVADATCFVNWKDTSDGSCQNACRQIMAAMIVADEALGEETQLVRQCNKVNQVGDTLRKEFLAKTIPLAMGFGNTAAHGAAFQSLVDHVATQSKHGNCRANCKGAAPMAFEFFKKVMKEHTGAAKDRLLPEDLDKCETITNQECGGRVVYAK